MPVRDELLATAERELGAFADKLGPLLGELVDSALGFMERETGRVLGDPRDEQRYLSGGNGRRRFLTVQDPAFTISEIAVQWTAGGDFVALDGSEWQLSGDHLLERTRGAAWPAGRRNVRVTLSVGCDSLDEWPNRELLLVFRHFCGAAFRGRRSAVPVALPAESETVAGLAPLDWRILRENKPMPAGF